MKCVKCGKIAEEAELSFQGHGIKGWKCPCGEEYFDPAEAERILLINKLKKRTFESKLGENRSNLILRIPKVVQEALGLTKGERVTLQIKGVDRLELIS
jgi:hypothetical protein